MPVTTVAAQTLQKALDVANPGQIADALRDIALGTLLASTEYDTGTITGSATVVLPFEAAIVQSARVVTSATGGSVGPYLVADSGATPAIPPTATAYAGAAIGVATLGTDRKTLTFPNTVTRVVVRYSPIGTALATLLAINSKA